MQIKPFEITQTYCVKGDEGEDSRSVRHSVVLGRLRATLGEQPELAGPKAPLM